MSDYKVLYGVENLNALSTCISVAFDTETLQLQPELGKLRLIQLGCKVSQTIVLIDCFELDADGWNKLKLFFTNGERYWLAHNAVFDIAWLQEHGIDIRGRIQCSMLASKMLSNGIPNMKHGLANVAKRYLNIDVDKEEQRSDWSGELTESQLTYAAKDVELLLDLDPIISRRLAASQLASAYALECQALPALAAMWRTGLPWNAEALEQLKKDYEFDIEHLGKEFLVELDLALPEEHKLPREPDESFNLRTKTTGSIREGTKRYAGFNINSPKQLVEKLTHVLGTPPIDSKTNKPSASRAALRNYAADHTVIQTYLSWKRAEKRRQMVVSIQEKLSDDGFCRASYMQLGAETGRMSCIKPNNQQIPRDPVFRSCVQAPEGWTIVDADYAGMELRLAAAIAEDKTMIKAFQDGADLHQVTADALGCPRQVAKSANFGLLFGSGAKGLRDYAGASGVIMTVEEAADIRNKWLDTYQGIKDWQQHNGEEALREQNNKWAEIRIPVTGFRRFVPGDMNRLTVRCNTPIQGAGAAILKLSLGNLWQLIRVADPDTVKLCGAVHDEIILLVREGHEDYWAQMLKDTMEDAESRWLGEVPAVAEVQVGKSWAEVH